MKKFFLTILLVITTIFTALAQMPLNLNAFQHQVTKGQCMGDSKLKITLPPGMGSAGTKVQVKLDIPNDPVGRTEPMEIGVSGKDVYEFQGLKVGTYTVTLIEVETNKRSNARTVSVTSNYVPPIFTVFKSYPPSCAGAGDDGRVEFTIQKGAKGPFEVVLKKGSTIVYSNNNLVNPNVNQPFAVTIQGTAAQPITAGNDYTLSVHDKAGGVSSCGDTNYRAFSVNQPELTIDCMEFEIEGDRSTLRVDKNCKFFMSFRLKRKDNVDIYGLESQIKARANTAVLRRYNSAGVLQGTYDITNKYQNQERAGEANAYSFSTKGVVQFEENDIVELTLNLGKTTVVKKFKLDENKVDVLKNRTTETNVAANEGHYIFLHRGGSSAIEATNRSDLNVNPADPCPTPNTKRYLLVNTYFRKVKLPNPDNASDTFNFGYYDWQGFTIADWLSNPSVGTHGFYYEVYQYTGTKQYPGFDAGSYTGGEINDNTKWQLLTPGSDYNWINNNGTLYADLSGRSDGYYKVKFKTKGYSNCYEPVRIAEVKTAHSKIAERFNGIEVDRGAYKGTVTLRKWVAGYHFNYPITVKLDYVDDGGTGTRTYDFQTALPFEPLRKVTYTFPMVKQVWNPDISNDAYRFEFGDIPPGQYDVTITDACGNAATKRINLDTPMQYDKDELKVVQGCQGTSKISYALEATPVGTIQYTAFTLFKKTNAGTWQQVERSRDRTHTFNNLSDGEYKFESTYYYHARIKEIDNPGSATEKVTMITNPLAALGGYSMVPSEDADKLSYDIANRSRITNHVSRVYLTISPTGALQRDVVGTSCSSAGGTGLVAVRVKNPEYINYPLQFVLKRPDGTQVSSSPQFQAASAQTGYVFKNVPNGTYVVETIHSCGSYPDNNIIVNSNNYTAPSITYISKSTNPCNGDEVELTFGGSTQLFDIEWFRVETDNTETSLGITQTITDTVKRATRYLVRYNLADTSLCVVNPSGVASITPQFTPDTTPPVITGCPTGTITVNTLVGQCYSVASWGVVTATDNCRVGAWSQTHQSGQHFDVGLHTVTYVFEDTSGNVATCTFNVEVKSNAIDMQMKDDFVDGTNGVITHNLATTESFYYRIKYKNIGQENVTSATMQITLPNHPGVKIGEPDFSGAIETTFRPVVTEKTSNTFTIHIPAQTLRPGQAEREIRIPLQLNGDCDEFGKPCMNILQASYTFSYEGGRPNCIVPKQTKTSSTTIQVSTASCNRSELYCVSDPAITTRLTAIAGFDRYIWYKDGLQQANPLNLNYIDATATGTYRVEKIKECNGTTYTTTEQIQLVDGENITDPIRSQANGGDKCASEDIYVSHIILCNESSRTLKVNFRNSKIEWQQLNNGASPKGQNCPNTTDSDWHTVSTNPSFTVNSTAHYRLRVTNAGGDCVSLFHFDVFNNALSGEVTNYNDIDSYRAGNISIKMATSGIAYKYVIKDNSGTVIPQNGQLSITKNSPIHSFTITNPGNYVIEVTSPSLPQSCKWTYSQEIKRTLKFTAKATAKAWKNCNLRTINFQASGGDPTFSFAIWSIDGVIQKGYTNYSDVQPSDYIVNGIPVGIIGQDRDVQITQPGSYVFLAKDAQNAYALTPAIDILPEDFLGYKINIRDVVCGALPNSGQISVTYNTQQNVKSILYRFDSLGNKVYVDENTTGFFNNLIAAKYELEIRVTMGSSASAVCTYSNPNLEVKSMDSTIRAYAGVAEDISCDTATPTKQYKVIINNVSGGTGKGYEFSANNVNYSTNPVLMVGSTASVVYVRDSNKCVLEIPIQIKPIVPATVTTTAVQYDCEGKGTFTVTTNPIGNYKFQITNADGTLNETRTSNVFTLSPGVYSIYAIYTPANVTGTTPNILFKENFGTGLDTCDSDVIFITCNSNGTALTNNQYMITRQVPTLPIWVSPTPIDASGVTDGRYLAINGGATANDSGVVYKRTINGVVVNQELSVSVNLFNLIPASYIGAINPNLVVRLYNPGNMSQYVEKSLGELQQAGAWVNKKVTFAATQVNYNSVVFEIRNIANDSQEGSDFAVDDIEIWQPTKVCEVRAEGVSVNIENNRKFAARGTAADEKCGQNDGSIFLTIDNPGGNSIEYQLSGTNSWTTVTLSATTITQGVATIPGLSAINNATIYIRKPGNANCVTSFNYTIKKPVPLTVTATIQAPVNCQNTFASVRFTAEGGARPYTTFRYSPIGGGTAPASKAAVNNEADFNLEQGTYRIEAVDANGCVASATFVVPNVKPLQIEVVDLEPCFAGGTSGRLQVNVLSGNGEYQFSKDNITYENAASASSTSFVFENLTAGSYTIYVRDGGSCTTQTTYTIENPLRIRTVLHIAKDCTPNSQAEFKITHSGGRVGTRQFLWSNNPTSGFSVAIPTGMSLSTSGNEYTFKTSIEGDYYFKVRYRMDNGDYCEVLSDKQTVKIVAPAFTTTPTVENVNCAGINTGKILLNSSSITGGIPPYSILLFNGITTAQYGVGDIVGLPAGTYTLTIEDSKHCTSEPMPVVITQVPAMVATVTHTNLKCTGSSGGTLLSTITAQVTAGGTAPFTITLRKNGFVDETRANVQINDAEQFTNKDIGRYQVLVEDSKGCKYTNDFVIASESDNLDVRSTTVVACGGTNGEVAVSVFASSGNTIANGQYIAVYHAGMTMPVGATLPIHTVGGHNWYRMGDVTTTTLSDGTIAQASTYTFTGLAPGVRYTFIVYDTNTGCSFTKEAKIKVPTTSNLEVTITGTKPTTCADNNDGKLNLFLKNWNTAGSINYNVYKYPPSNPVLTNPVDAAGNNLPVGGALPLTGTSSVGENVTIQNIPAGRYFVLFTDPVTLCTMGSEEFTIGKSSSLLTATVTVTKNANCQQPANNGLGKVVVDAAGGTAPYQYYYEVYTPVVLTGNALDNAFNINNHQASRDLPSGTYRVYVRDANGCDKNYQVTVGMDSTPAIASVAVHDACSENADYPISVIFATKGVGQHLYKIDGITNWQNFTVPTSATDNEALLPIRLAPNVASYTLSIRDANGCETGTTFRVNEMIKFKASHTPIVPCGNGTADINVTNITGGSGAYRISLYRLSSQPDNTQRSVPIITADNVTGNSYNANGATYTITAGNYRINVYDAATFGTSAECAQTMNFTVAQPQMPTIEVLSITTPSCANQTATVRVKVTPASDAPYVFDLVDKVTTSSVIGSPVVKTDNLNYVTFEGVPSGPISLGGAKYIVKAKSAYGCEVTTEIAVIAPDAITINPNALTKEDYRCERDSGYLTGETTYPKLKLDLSGVTGGTLPYSRVEFREVGSNVVINQQTVEDNVNKYTYTLPNYLTANTNYYARVYDANGCEASTGAVTISSTLAMSSLTASQTQALTCVNTGEIFNVTLSSTTVYNNERIEYIITKAGYLNPAIPNQILNSMTYNNVTLTEAGNYVITARNLSTGCEVSTNYTVLDPSTLLLEAKDITRVTCKGGTGQVTLELTDTRLTDGDQVANGFNYVIYDIATNSAVVSGTTNGTLTSGKTQQTLNAGKYRVEASSLITGCTANTTFELIEAERPITVFAQETASVTCDNNRGEILVTVSGGWAPYRVDIQGGAITGQKDISIDGDSTLFKNLVSTGTPGGVVTYTITITDAWGCQIASGTTQVGLLHPDTITGTITVTQHATCFGSSDGIIEAIPSTITGGSGNYYYSLIDANYNTLTQRDNGRFDNLLPGIYTFEIMDTWGCNVKVEQLEVVEPKPITVSETTSNLLVCYGGNDGSFDFHVAGGRPPYTVEIVDKYTNITYHYETNVYSTTLINSPNTPPTGAGYPAGTYKIIVTDSGQGAGVGCTMSPSYEFTVYSSPDLDAETVQRYNCDNNEFTTYIEVRFKDEVNFNNMTYKLNGSSVAQTFSRNNGVNVGYIDQTRFDRSIATQTLEIEYTSVHSVTGMLKVCNQVLTKPISIEEIYQITNIVKTPTTVVNTLQVEGVGGRKPYRYEFNGEYYDDKNIYELKLTDPDYTDPVSGKTYKIVKVRVFDSASENPNPGNGCVLEKIFYEEYFDVFIPNFFTPNGDGTYDTWAPRNVEKYPFIRATIFDRYGRRLAVLNQKEEWDGKYEGRDMPTGDYWYIVELGDENDSRTFHGNFTLYR